MANNELLNFFLDLRSDEPESFSVLLELSSLSEKVELILKECDIKNPVCHIEDQDIKNS